MTTPLHWIGRDPEENEMAFLASSASDLKANKEIQNLFLSAYESDEVFCISQSDGYFYLDNNSLVLTDHQKTLITYEVEKNWRESALERSSFLWVVLHRELAQDRLGKMSAQELVEQMKQYHLDLFVVVLLPSGQTGGE